MKSKVVLYLLVGLITLSSCRAQKVNKSLHEFTNDFASANVQLRGELRLFGEYKGDLSTLTYESYLEHLKANNRVSSQGVFEVVINSDQQQFLAKTNTFLIVIYSKRLNAIVFDDANTSRCDSVRIFQKGDSIPDISRFIRKE